MSATQKDTAMYLMILDAPDHQYMPEKYLHELTRESVMDHIVEYPREVIQCICVDLDVGTSRDCTRELVEAACEREAAGGFSITGDLSYLADRLGIDWQYIESGAESPEPLSRKEHGTW
jgi:hypothetical protein